MTELQQLQSQLAEAVGRIQHLEEEINQGKESPRWQYLIARPHRWRRQLCRWQPSTRPWHTMRKIEI